MAFLRKKSEFRPDSSIRNWTQRLYLSPQQQKRYLKWILLAVLSVLSLLLQDVLFSRISIYGSTVDLVPCALIVICVMQGIESGCVFLLIGALVYYFSGSSPGVYVILLIPLLFILFNAYATWIAMVQTSTVTQWMILISAVLWMAVAIYAFALQATFENTPMRTVMNALRIALCNFFKTVILLVIFAASIGMFIIFPLGAMFYTPICVFLAARPIWSVFKKVIEMPEVTVTNQE